MNSEDGCFSCVNHKGALFGRTVDIVQLRATRCDNYESDEKGRVTE